MIFSLAIAVLGLAVMVGFVTNLASETIERERIQHAADSVAYASGVWLARAMNTACSINHVLGERTAYAVAIDSLCGPETMFDPCKEEAEMNDRLKESGYLSYKEYSPRPQSDESSEVQKTIENFTDKYYPEGDYYRAGAGVYDAKMNLKYYATDCLNNKAIATLMMSAKDKGLSELSACYPLGTGIHYTESFVLGLNMGGFSGMKSITDALDNGLSKLGDLESVGNNIANMGRDIQKLGNRVSGWGKKLGDVGSELNSIKISFADQISKLKELGVDVSEVENAFKAAQEEIDNVKGMLTDTGKNLTNNAEDIISQQKGRVLDKEGGAIIKANASLNSINNKLSDVKNALTNLLNNASGKISDVVDSALSGLDGVVNGITGQINRLASSVTAIGKDVGDFGDDIGDDIKDIGDIGSKLQEAAGYITDAKNQLGKFTDAVSNPIGTITQFTGKTTITSEREIILELEAQLEKKGDKKSAHEMRNTEAYGNVEKITHRRFAPIVGSDQDVDDKKGKPFPEDRILYQKIYETVEELQKAYAVEGSKNKNKDEGFADCVVAPLDTLVPDAKYFTTDGESRIPNVAYKSVDQNDMIHWRGFFDKTFWEKLKDTYGWNFGTNAAGLIRVRNELEYTFPMRVEQYNSWIAKHQPLDVESVCNQECREAYQLYNRNLRDIMAQFRILKMEGDLLRATVAQYCGVTGESIKRMYIDFVVDVAMQRIKFPRGQIGRRIQNNVEDGLKELLHTCLDDKDVKDLVSGRKTAEDLDLYEAYKHGGISDTAKSALDWLVASSDDSITNVVPMDDDETRLHKGQKVFGILDTACRVASFMGAFLGENMVMRKGFIDMTNHFLAKWEPLENMMNSLELPQCQALDCDGNGQSRDSDALRHKPLLPVLAETKTLTTSSGLGFISQAQYNINGQEWTQSSNSPYAKLPKVPWNGTDKDTVVPTIQTTIRYLNYVTYAAFGAAIAYYCCTWQFPRAIAAGEILAHMVAFQVSIDSSWKPGDSNSDGYIGHKNNPSVWSYPVGEFDYDAEKLTQWVRSTYPVVDTLRGALRKHYKSKVPISNLSTYLTAWCYRYTLSESYYLHTGATRPYPEANKTVQPCYMYVIAGTNTKNKGQESFWDRPEVLDQMFSVCAVVRSDPRSAAAGSKTFKRMGQKDGIMAAAQATFYPSNGRNLTKNGKLANPETLGIKDNKYKDCQPYTCWDTLQWKNFNPGEEPIIRAPEWWNSEPSFGAGIKKNVSTSYKDLVADGHTVETLDSSKIELSWEAMLSPVTKSRLERVSSDSKAHEAVKHAAQNAAAHAETLAN